MIINVKLWSKKFVMNFQFLFISKLFDTNYYPKDEIMHLNMAKQQLKKLFNVFWFLSWERSKYNKIPQIWETLRHECKNKSMASSIYQTLETLPNIWLEL
jgi:hypothetical protein